MSLPLLVRLFKQVPARFMVICRRFIRTYARSSARSYTQLVSVVSLTVSSVVFSGSAAAVPAMGMGYEPKYSADYMNFDYVNPAAPEKGELVMMALGAFDSLNPYLLKGISASGLGTLVFESLLEKSMDEPFSEYGLIRYRVIVEIRWFQLRMAQPTIEKLTGGPRGSVRSARLAAGIQPHARFLRLAGRAQGSGACRGCRRPRQTGSCCRWGSRSGAASNPGSG